MKYQPFLYVKWFSQSVVYKMCIEIDDKKVEISHEKNYIALNKPAGYVTTREDELNRKTVMELIPQIPNLKPVGRLDKDTEGLLLFSNDGDFINKLTHTKFECEKEYYVEIKGKLEILMWKITKHYKFLMI